MKSCPTCMLQARDDASVCAQCGYVFYVAPPIAFVGPPVVRRRYLPWLLLSVLVPAAISGSISYVNSNRQRVNEANSKAQRLAEKLRADRESEAAKELADRKRRIDETTAALNRNAASLRATSSRLSQQQESRDREKSLRAQVAQQNIEPPPLFWIKWRCSRCTRWVWVIRDDSPRDDLYGYCDAGPDPDPDTSRHRWVPIERTYSQPPPEIGGG